MVADMTTGNSLEYAVLSLDGVSNSRMQLAVSVCTKCRTCLKMYLFMTFALSAHGHSQA